MTTADVAARFHELAQQEKWFEIQDELFADDVKSVEHARMPYMDDAEGKALVRAKGETFVSKITAFNSGSTSEPMVAGQHFVVHRQMDIETSDHGRIAMNELMLYEVQEGKITAEHFYY